MNPDEPVIHVVPEDPPRLRLDAYALAVFPWLASRSQAKKAAKQGRLEHNEAKADTARFVRAGDTLTLFPAGPPRFQVYPLDLELPYVDEHVAVVVKPAGLHTSGNLHRTLAHALPPHLPPPELPDALPAPWPVHRLDARTSGLVVVARTASARKALGQAFADRAVSKTYRTVVVGHVEGAGTCTEPLDGLRAVTHYRPLRASRSLHVGWITELEVDLETGRTHQIRRHLAGLGHPVVGDDRYDPNPLRGHGLFLRATRLELAHPCRPGRLKVQTDPPSKFRVFLDREQRRWDRARGVAPGSRDP